MLVAFYLKFETLIKIYIKFMNGDLFKIYIYLKFKIIQNISSDLSLENRYLSIYR